MFLRTLMVSMGAMVLAAGAAWAQTTGGTVVGPPASGAGATPGPHEPGGMSQNGTPSYNYGRRWQNGNYYQGQYYNPYYNGPTWGIDPYYYGR